MVEAGQLTAGHARALLAFDDPEPVARRIVERGLNVREVEQLAQRAAARAAEPAAPRAERQPRGGGHRRGAVACLGPDGQSQPPRLGRGTAYPLQDAGAIAGALHSAAHLTPCLNSTPIVILSRSQSGLRTGSA